MWVPAASWHMLDAVFLLARVPVSSDLPCWLMKGKTTSSFQHQQQLRVNGAFKNWSQRCRVAAYYGILDKKRLALWIIHILERIRI